MIRLAKSIKEVWQSEALTRSAISVHQTVIQKQLSGGGLAQAASGYLHFFH